MKAAGMLNSISAARPKMAPRVYLEIGQSALKVLNEDEGLELPLERQPNGRLTTSCKEALAGKLRTFLQRKSWQPHARAFCAVGARGVSMRRLTLPPAAKDSFQRMLLMQIENEFPLSPDELAWGYRILGGTRPNGVAKQELLVIAVRKEMLADYEDVLSRCELNPVFTLAALARGFLASPAIANFAVLDLASDGGAELVQFSGDVPNALRVVSWNGSPAGQAQSLDAIEKSLAGIPPGGTLFISGPGDENILLPLRKRMGERLDCKVLERPTGEGRSAAVLGLKKAVEENASQLVLLSSKQANGRATAPAPVLWKLGAIAALLALAALALPYAEALILKPILARRIAMTKAESEKVTGTLDQELSFLQFLKQSQPPYLDALYLFSKSAASGSKIESLTMNRRGEVTLRGSMRNADEVSGFRAKLIASGFFTNVVVEEQTPAPNHQKVDVRIVAVWKSFAERQTLAIGPNAEEIEKAKKEPMPGMTPGGMPPEMMPPGMMPPGMMPPGAMPVSFPAGALPPGVHVPPAIMHGSVPPGMPSGIILHGAPPGAIPPGAVPSQVERHESSDPSIHPSNP